MAKLTSADIKLLIYRDLDFTKGASPAAEAMYVRQWEKRKHLTNCDLATPSSKNIKRVLSLKYDLDTRKLAHPDVNNWKQYLIKDFCAGSALFNKNGTYRKDALQRISKSKKNGNTIRAFTGLMTLDHHAIVETDAADENVLSITYEQEQEMFPCVDMFS
jgi:hypothetical protein